MVSACFLPSFFFHWIEGPGLIFFSSMVAYSQSGVATTECTLVGGRGEWLPWPDYKGTPLYMLKYCKGKLLRFPPFSLIDSMENIFRCKTSHRLLMSKSDSIAPQ